MCVLNLPAEALPLWLLLAAAAAWCGLLLRALVAAPWRLLQANGLVSVYAAAIALSALLWSMQVGVREGLTLHLLGTATLVLMFGPALALVAGGAVLVLLAGAGIQAPLAFGVHGLLLVALPVTVASRLHGLLRRRLPAHPFIYFLGSGFLGGMLALGSVVLASALLILALGLQPPATVRADYLALMPLLLFPEGFINGAVITALAVFRPEWVRSFDDRAYLDDE
ncbi:energy-coupling factor ABC transporter permease [Spiribacter halobius]|uniref:Uncharacterized protein n=1 Tax=Sediminicurvatus halobius TaxID=2182432 RepID=A0A2U2N0U5_9GAMM|nr:energy-coupling factor ABC transporter permease [Spiribacter halobius]PWG62806.1 hypothetical protein DEM34_10570 [Spiribacter halobius]UEX77047.1 energy-coupling factor ABC transporter permease [Spiribacter halobius]